MLTSISVILRYGVRCNVAVLLSCVTVVVPVATSPLGDLALLLLSARFF